MLSEELNLDEIINKLLGETLSKEKQSERVDCSEYCDNCVYLKFRPDPDPYDSFEADDQKAVCLSVRGAIRVSLRPYECHNILKPLFCPIFGRELSDKEKEEASKRREWAKERFN